MEPLRGDHRDTHVGTPKETKPAHPTQKKVAEVSKKAKEAEEIQRTPQKLTRQASLHSVRSGEKSEKEEIARKDGGLWHCIGRTPNKEGGYIYHFKLRPEFDDITPHPDEKDGPSMDVSCNPDGEGGFSYGLEPKFNPRREAQAAKSKEMFPAVEPIGKRSVLWNSKIDFDAKIEQLADEALKANPFNAIVGKEAVKLSISNQVKSQIQENLIFQGLGFTAERAKDGVYLNLPDQEALLAKWELLRQTRPDLPRLDIISSEGIASDIDFLEAFFTHDVLLSTGKEFVHDHLAHVTAQIQLVLSGTPSDYKKERVNHIKQIAKSYRRLIVVKRQIEEGKVRRPKEELEKIKERLDQFEAVLGALVDVIASEFSYSSAHPTLQQVANNYRDVWVQRWEKGLDPNLLLIFMEGEIKEIEDEYNKLKRR